MLLESLMSGLEYKVLTGSLLRNIESVQQDSRKVGPGTLFLAIKGFKSDGHRFAAAAAAAGAEAIVVSETDQIDLSEMKRMNVSVILVSDDRHAMSHLASAFNGHPSRQLCMVGLTGTNGKTSTCRILSDMLNAGGMPTGLLGTIANEIGGKVYKSSLTTPEPIELHGLLRAMVEDGVKACVMEASSHALDLKRVEHVEYDYAVFTNLTEDHLDYHEDFEAYFMAKSKLFDMAKAGRLINIDDPYGRRLYASFADGRRDSGAVSFSYAIEADADIQARDIQYMDNETRYNLTTPRGQVEIVIPLPGQIYVYNTLAAFGTLYMMGMSLEEIKEASAAIKLVPGRMERVGKSAGVKVFVDYAHTPDALENAIDIARSMTAGRVITVFGCGGDRDAKKRPMMGRIAEAKSDQIIVTSDNPRTEDPLLIIEDILAGLENKEQALVVPDRKSAICSAIEMAADADVVLIAGKGHETYQEICGVRHDFDDRKVAGDCLNREEKYD